jgi:hypothetical protein
MSGKIRVLLADFYSLSLSLVQITGKIGMNRRITTNLGNQFALLSGRIEALSK